MPPEKLPEIKKVETKAAPESKVVLGEQLDLVDGGKWQIPMDGHRPVRKKK